MRTITQSKFPYQSFLSIFLLTIGLGACSPNQSPKTNNQSTGKVVVASKGFTEQDILMEMLAQQIENKANLQVERRRFTSALIAHNAITTGKIDAYIEYTGTAFVGILKQPTETNPQIVYDKLKQMYAQQFQLEVMPSLGFENTFAMIVRPEDAQKFHIKTLSDVAKVAPKWRAGFGYEFVERQDGFPGLAKTYNWKFSQSPKLMDLGLIYKALLQKDVDIVNGNSTDGQIAQFNLVVLNDDKKYFPPYQAVPIIRQDTIKKYPQLKDAVNQLSGKISAQEMQQLNYQVQEERQDVKAVVTEFLKKETISKLNYQQ